MLQNLKLLRKKAGISQQALADAIGVSQQSVNQYENHDIEPDITVLCQIADYFHSTIDDLVGRTPTGDWDTQMFLNKSEAVLIGKYRALTDSEQACVQNVVNTLLEKD